MRPRNARKRAAAALDRLEPLYGRLSTGLDFSSPLELLVATILSAQCTDERVNSVTPALFARCPTVHEYAEAPAEAIETIIYPCGFYRAKTRNLQGMARAVIERYNGEIPDTMEELLTLPGVARKTANVVLSHAFGVNAGIAVDTHVQRLSGRLRLSAEVDPVKIERDLMALVPQERWGRISDFLIWHGRRVCGARAPACVACVMADLCPASRVPVATTASDAT